MSLLIKALRQAEREHLASAAAAAPVPPPAPAAPVPQSALQLEPVDDADASGDAHGGARPLGRAVSGDVSSARDASIGPGEEPPDSAEVAPGSGHLTMQDSAPEPPVELDPARTPTTQESGPARDAAAQDKKPALTTAVEASGAAGPGDPEWRAQQSTATLLASVTAAAAATTGRPDPAGGRRAATAGKGEHVTTAPPAAAGPAPADPDGDARAAARYLVTQNPDRLRVRRVRMLAGAIAGVAVAALAFAFWQGLLPQFASYQRVWTDAPGTPVATARPAPASAYAVGAPAAPKSPGSRDTGKAAAQPAGARASTRTGAGAAAAVSTAPQATAVAAAAAAGAEAGRSSATIHLQPPEVSAEGVRALLQQAYAAAARGDANTARTAYERVVEIDRNSGDAWIGLATLAVNAGDAAGATRYYRHALDIDPMDSVALGGFLGLQSGVEPQEYEARLRQLIARDGNQPTLLAALGKLAARQGRWLEAQEAFFQAWAADPTQADVAFNLAVSLERIRQPEAAASYYRRALQLTQNHKARFDEAVARERIAALSGAAPATASDAAHSGGEKTERTGATAPTASKE